MVTLCVKGLQLTSPSHQTKCHKSQYHNKLLEKQFDINEELLHCEETITQP